MTLLTKDWLIEGTIDFEYKKYVLLAYLKQVKENFDLNRLYPFFSDLVFHYQNLMAIKNNKQSIQNVFPKRVTKADLRKLELIYKKIVQDDEIMQELEEIIDFAEPKLRRHLEDGKAIYELVEENMEIEPVGLSPIYVNEGYMLVRSSNANETRAYQYQVSIFENASERFRSINTTYVETFTRSITMTFENMKTTLSRRNRELPNPATYLITDKMGFPFDETTFPVAKRTLMRHISIKMA